MRRVLVSVVLVVTILSMARPVRAQDLEVTPFGGLGFGGTFELEDGELSIDQGSRVGFIVDVPVLEGVQLEFRYGRQRTEMRQASDDLFVPSTPAFDATVHHVLGGILWEIGGGRFRPFVVATIGAAGFGPEPDDLVTEWRFAAGLGGGIKAVVSDHVGLRLEALALPALVDPGTRRLFCTSPAGRCLATVTGTSALYQGSIAGGLILSF